VADALKAEVPRLNTDGCARDQSTTQFWKTCQSPPRLITDNICLTPAEVAAQANDALMEAARQSALEEAAQEMDCACPQRGAVLAKLAKDGPLSHHWPCEKSDDCCALRGAAIRALKGEGDE
jgi:hypothetical protein